MSKSIFELVDELPTNNMTMSLLNSLDFVAPGEWQNIVGFVNTIKTVTGETDEALIQQIGERADLSLQRSIPRISTSHVALSNC